MRARWTMVVLGVVTFGAGCADSVVGAECRPGFAPSDGRCVRVMADGGLGDGAVDVDGALPDGALPDGRVPFDAGVLDGSQPLPDGARPDGALPDGAIGDGGAGDAGPPLCDIGELECDGVCVRPRTDPTNCGGCGIECDSGELCAGGECTALCDPPLMRCGGACIDTSSDPDNCGSCGNRCPSGICEAGECQSPMAGHLVAVGHDYRNSRRGQNRVAGNSVFLARGAPVRVLVYEGEAPASAIAGVDRAIDQVSTDTGRSWMRTAAADPREVPLLLADAEAFVIYSQRSASDTMLRKLGEQWARALESFLDRGGVVVLFDGTGSNEGTWQILDEAGLFLATGRTDVSSDVVRVVRAGDGVAVGVPLSYRGETSTVRFDTTEETVVVEHDEGPVVVHRVFAP